MSQTVSTLATDVGLWMALPAFGPAFLIVAVVFYIVRRDRRGEGDESESDVRLGQVPE